MAKKIRFYIVMNKQQIRTLDDLEQNFHAQDILCLYQEGVLERWLEASGYTKQLENVRQLQREECNGYELLAKLADIFLGKDAHLEGVSHYIDYLVRNKEHMEKYGSSASNRQQIIENYHAGYAGTVAQLIEHENNMEFAKGAIQLITQQYMELFALDYDRLINRLANQAPAVLFVILANPEMRNWLEEKERFNALVKRAYEELSNNKLKKFLEPVEESPVQSLFLQKEKHTQGTWDDIEPDTSKQFMIIQLFSKSDLVRDYSLKLEPEKRKELNMETIITTFPLLHGIEYKSNTRDSGIIYMEV